MLTLSFEGFNANHHMEITTPDMYNILSNNT